MTSLWKLAMETLEHRAACGQDLFFVLDPRREARLHLRIGSADFHANEIAACTTLE